jgi:hypothetical protein
MLLEECFYKSVENEEQKQIQGLTRAEKKQFACLSISDFFSSKSLYYGGSIPEYVLYSEENLDRVVDTEIEEGVEKIYQAMGDESVLVKKKCSQSGSVLPSSEKVIRVLEECGKRYIPKTFAAGITMMYFQLCEGLDIE